MSLLKNKPHNLSILAFGYVNLEQEITVLKGQVASLRRELRNLTELVDTINSPLWKRILFVAQGYRWKRVGRWYGKTEDLK